MPKPFHFKQFKVYQDNCAMKVGTDGVLLGAWCTCDVANTILDVGTGTGIIPLMLAQRNSTANITAIEIDVRAAHQAKENIEISSWSNRISIYSKSYQEFAKTNQSKFDLITCNPPFFPRQKFTIAKGDRRAQARNTIALPFDVLIKLSKKLLTDQGKLALIIPKSEHKQIAKIISQNKLYIQRFTKVRPTAKKAIHRHLLEIVRYDSIIMEQELIIQKGGRNEFTNAYIKLTKDFYTIM